MTTNVLVKDGLTIVIGGLFRERSSIKRAQVPLVGNIPLVGALFRSTSDQSTREEVIFLVTPHIVKEDVDYAAGQEALVTLVALGIEGKKQSIEDTACADYLEQLLTEKENYSHLEFIKSLFDDDFTKETLKGKQLHFPITDIVLSIQRDLFDFALIVEVQGSSLFVSRIN